MTGWSRKVSSAVAARLGKTGREASTSSHWWFLRPNNTGTVFLFAFLFAAGFAAPALMLLRSSRPFWGPQLLPAAIVLLSVLAWMQ